MAQYIDKSAIVAEIERIMAEEMSFFEDCCKDELENTSSPAVYTRMEILLSFLDTLEVKEEHANNELKSSTEVDLEKELDEWIKYGPHTNYPWCTIPDAIRITAEHFYELGLNAKGE